MTDLLVCQQEAKRFATTRADVAREMDATLAHLATALASASTPAARREALDTAAAALGRCERASGRVGAGPLLDRTFGGRS